MIRVQPVAHGGMDAKMGAKKIEMIKQRPVIIAVKPVLPPSAIPEPDSINAVTGDVPSKAPIEIDNASTEYATVERGKLPLSGSTTPANLAMLHGRQHSKKRHKYAIYLYNVAVQSRIST